MSKTDNGTMLMIGCFLIGCSVGGVEGLLLAGGILLVVIAMVEGVGVVLKENVSNRPEDKP